MNNQKVNWAVDDAVREAMHRAVIGAVCKAVYWTAYWVADDDVYRAVIRAGDASVWGAVTGSVRDDLEHPAFQEFLRSAGRT